MNEREKSANKVKIENEKKGLRHWIASHHRKH